MKRLAILLSGRGSNFEAIADSIRQGRLPASIEVVVSNLASAPGLEKARRRGLTTLVIPSRGVPREDYDRSLVYELRRHRVDLVCLAGFMRILSPLFVRSFRNRILNIHPSLLPAFPGLHPQRQALEYGVRFSGCTVHLVDEGVDSGPILLQAAVPVLESDNEESLAARILAEEHRLYPQAIGMLVRGEVRLEGRRVIRRF
ncbi:MAG: phosphoribosylglycinamide formyltransferase [Acidobacteria bacterium]|nr:phosphoribosylglycinamide formyltransferase [Acidobacteriota bacterium]MYC80592.1 phosphoribosylglycinamide formyltransferase [Acidobacteriota bacterium]